MNNRTKNSDGKVFLVGAGPGNPDLLTVRAKRLIENADVLLHDALTGHEIIDLAPYSAEVVDVGKRPSSDSTPQASTNQYMVRKAREGREVIRLKGGDPNVFGRGGEEAEYLAERNVRFEVVPGVSSVLGGPGRNAIPLTHRDHASTVTLVTGHEDPSKDQSAINWSAVAANLKAGGTVVILMGVGRVHENTEALIEQNVDPDTPAAVIEKATFPDEVTVEATLDKIAQKTDEHHISPPALFVVGGVVNVRQNVYEQLERSGTRQIHSVFN